MDIPVEALSSYIQNPGEEPEWVEMGVPCQVCRFAEGPVATRMRHEAEMGLEVTEEEAEPPGGLEVFKFS